MSKTVHWPAPPFFKPADQQPPGSGRECTVELTDGRIVRQELVEFQPGSEVIAVRSPEGERVKEVPLTHIRSIRWPAPVGYVPDSEALQAVGVVDPNVGNRKPFALTLIDGTRGSGHTLGFVKVTIGLFLFLVDAPGAGTSDSEPVKAVHCFVPAVQIKDLQIGPQLGDVLLENHDVSADSLAQALSKQAQLRQEKIGKYLTDRAIIAPRDLLVALRAQEKRPTVRLGDLLVEAELITKEQLAEALSIQARQRVGGWGRSSSRWVPCPCE